MIKKETIYLAPELIFPIINDENGRRLKEMPGTGFEFAGTLQGEGKMAGMPVLFLRTAGCNLRCMWNLPNGEVSICDTPLASFDTSLVHKYDVERTKKLILANMENLQNLVVSGGEPFMQPIALAKLIRELKKEKPDVKVAIETNGTIYNEELAEELYFFSISPKLRNSVPTAEKLGKISHKVDLTTEQADKRRVRLDVIQTFIDHCRSNPQKDFQLKFVIKGKSEIEEIEDSFLRHLKNWEKEDIVLMPVGSTPEELRQTRLATLEASILKGWRYSPRLHINYFLGKAGV